MLSELWRQYKYEGDLNAKEKLIFECLPTVKSLAQRFSAYSFPCLDTDDLINVGIIGLLDALEKYSPAMEAKLKTYAKYRIRGAILDEIRSLQWTPRSVQEKIQSLKRAYTHLEQKLSRLPTEEELADTLCMDLDEFHRMMVNIGPATLLTMNWKDSDDEDSWFQESSIEDPKAINPLDHVVSEEIKSILANGINSLPECERLVITLYYYEEMTMREIGEVLSITESRVCQIHSRALLYLFQMLRPKIITPEVYNLQESAINC